MWRPDSSPVHDAGNPSSFRRVHVILLSIFFSVPCALAFSLGCDTGPPRAATAPSPAGTATAPTGMDRTIRAMLMDQVNTCELVLDAPAELIETGTGRTLYRTAAPGRLTLRFEGETIVLPEAGQSLAAASIDIRSSGGTPVELVTPRGIRRYPGTLRLAQRSPGVGAVINVVDIEQYLVGVVAPETPASFHPEAFRAQAIAARTYAWYARQTARAGREWDVLSTESSQVYVGMPRSEVLDNAARAVRDTAGLVCTWPSPAGERIFSTYYSSTCGGSTQAAGPVKNEPLIPPLAGNVQCDWCRASPTYRWEPVRILKSRLTEALRARYQKFNDLGPIQHMEVIRETPTGRPVRLEFFDAEGRSLQLEAENFRLAVDPSGREIKSTFFTPVDEPDAIVLSEGRGFGHGMGLCQYGAEGQARAGRTAAEILQFYYPGSRITRAY